MTAHVPPPALPDQVRQTRIDLAAAYRLIHRLGLDDPLIVQYWNWLTQAVRGNLGRSYFSQIPVAQSIGQRSYRECGYTRRFNARRFARAALDCVRAAAVAAVLRSGLRQAGRSQQSPDRGVW